MIKSKTSSIQRALLAATAAMTMPPAAYSDMVTDWNEIAIQTFPSTVLGPTHARFLGIVHAAIYDAINAIDRKHQVYAIEIKAPLGASMEAAAATAAHDTLIKLFPVQQSALDTALAESLSTHVLNYGDVFSSGCRSQLFGGDLRQKSMEIVAGEGPVEGRCRPLVVGLKGKQALFEFL
jgi:hypothetical protein